MKRLGTLLTILLCGLVASGGQTAGARSIPAPGTRESADGGNLPVPAVSFPLRVEQGRRYLVDASGRPFLIQGDAAWSLIAQLKREDVDRYLEARRKQGFNTVLVELMEHKFSSHPPANAYGVGPLSTPGDFLTPSAAYFDHAEYVIAKAAKLGMLVLLAPAYMGYEGGDQGWYGDLVANGPQKLREYGRFVGHRFKDYSNILWVHGGDFIPPERTVLRAIADGIRDSGGTGLHSYHASRGHSALDAVGQREAWLNVDTIYTDEKSVVPAALREYGNTTLPYFLIEARYEGEMGAGDEIVRLQAYQALLSGACGQVMGNNPVWKFGDGWQLALNSPGARSMRHLRNLLDSVHWWELVPDTSGTFLIAGAGSGARAAAAVASDGEFAIAFLPSVRAVTLNLRRMHGPRVEARWYDPTSGKYRPINGSPFESSALQVLSPDGNNAVGAGDWVLLLRSVP